MAIDREELLALIPAMRRYSRAMTGSIDAADDLVQDCLVLALAREQQFRGGHLAAWLFAILVNHLRSRMRATRRRPAAEMLGDIADGGTDPALRVAIITALSALPAEQREALLLSSVEGFSYDEIAEIVGVPVGTVMSRIWRARTALAGDFWTEGVVPFRRTTK